MQTIGMMRNYKEPTKLAVILAKSLRYYHIDLIYLTPTSVNTVADKVTGYVLRDETWVTVVVDVPKVIDISTTCFRREYADIIAYLQENVYLTDDMDNRINKNNIHEYIKQDEELSKYSIASQLVGDLPSLIAFIEEHRSVVLKPEFGGNNRHVYLIEKKLFGSYKVQFNKESINHTAAKLAEYMKEHNLSSYVMQKYIQSQTWENQPFNCRIHLEKNGFNDWVVASIHAKVDLEKNIVGKIEQGNGVLNIHYILENLFEEKSQAVYDKILELADIIPYKIERIRERSLMTLGVDIGISKRGNLYIYEVLGSPSTEYLEYEVVNLRMQYYKYLLDEVAKENEL